MQLLKSLWTALFLAAPALTYSAPPATYYVASNGNNQNTGSKQSPLQTISYALSKAMPGDVVLVRGGNYAEKVVFPRSGSQGQYITLKAYTGEKPVINGSTLTVNGFEGLVTINNVSWVIMDGFEVSNFKSNSASGFPDGIVVKGAGSHIIVRNNEIHDIAHEVAPEKGRSAHAISVLGNSPAPITQLTITGNIIHDCKTGYSENLTINGYVDTFFVTHNKIYNCENIGIDAAGGYWANPDSTVNFARNGVISDNVLYNVDASIGPIRPSGDMHGAIGIYVDGARSITIERNKIYDSDRGISLASENQQFPSMNCIVRDNLVYNCWLAGIDMGGYVGYNNGRAEGNRIVNNTLKYNNKVKGHNGETEGEIRLTENCIRNTIRGNRIYARDSSDVFIHKYSSSGHDNIIDDNRYFIKGSGQWIWNGQLYTKLADWQAACQCDAKATIRRK